jgi:hypothetical protein
MKSPNPYESPREDPASSAGQQQPGGLWPHSRRRRERLIYGTVRSWLLFGLRALIFFVVIAALLILSRQAQP